MIEPVMQGRALLADIENAQPIFGQACIWWLGQSGYAIKTASALFYIDLYLSEHLTQKYANTENPHIRMTAAPLRGEQITNARWVFASHKHSDHLDPGTLPALFAASAHAHLVLPTALIDHAVKLGLPRERFIPTRGDETLTLDGITIHSIPSAHPNLDYNETTGYPFLGFGFEVDGLKLYHSGDTILYDGLAERLNQLQPDLVFLPINGTDARRKMLNIAPNTNPAEAVELAQQIGKPLLIPHHYDMFTFNTVDVREFIKRAETVGQPYQVLQAGERFTFQR